MGFRKILIKALFGKTAPTIVIEKKVEIHHDHHYHHYPKGSELPLGYNDGSRTARQGGSSLGPVKELANVWN